ncbi:MAG: CheY-like chemotaxis protein/GAF domain-containing protein [Myxococcota bacterium]|jgi:CheY-like chemotaxis protein/GAF domain-containing protein
MDATSRVLVVDDEGFFREAIGEILGGDDWQCTMCPDGESAVELAQTQTFAVAVLDIRLPGIDGIEVLRQLRSTQPQMRFVMLSASTDQELVLEALRLGASEYLAKPLHDEELVLAVRRAAEAHHISNSWSGLRTRLDLLVEGMEGLSHGLSRAEPGEAPQKLYDATVRAVAQALQAEKTSLMLLNEDGDCLDVVAVLGRDVEPGQMDSVRVGHGIAGRALEDLAPQVVTDIRGESHFAADLAPDRYASDSFAVAPIQFGGKALGVICATDRRNEGVFDHEDLLLLRLIAILVAGRLSEDEPLELETPAALELDPEISAGELMPLDLAQDLAEAAGIVGDASDRDAELARKICDAMVNEIDPESVLRESLRSIENTLGADPVALYLFDRDRGDLRMESDASRGLRLDRERLPQDVGLTGSVMQRGQLIAVSDPEADTRFITAVDTASDGKPGPLLCVPVQLRGKTVGLCRIHLAPGASVSARTGEVLAAVLSAAVRNVLLYRSLLESIDEVATARRESRA